MTEPRKLRVFLCHASQDKPVVRELYQRLLAEGWIDPWLDEDILDPWKLDEILTNEWKSLYYKKIKRHIHSTDVFIVCLSNDAVSKRGYEQEAFMYPLFEAQEKDENTILIIPIRLDDCIPPTRFQLWRWLDYFDNHGYGKLLQGFYDRSLKLSCLLPEVSNMGEFTINSRTNVNENKKIELIRILDFDIKRCFWISQYPVTCAQYERFLRSDDYYEEEYWKEFPIYDEDGNYLGIWKGEYIGAWRPEGIAWLKKQRKDFAYNPIKMSRVQPHNWKDSELTLVAPNAPVRGISWYEANAYCKWLNKHWNDDPKIINYSEVDPSLSLVFRLPTENEWIIGAKLGGFAPQNYDSIAHESMMYVHRNLHEWLASYSSKLRENIAMIHGELFLDEHLRDMSRLPFKKSAYLEWEEDNYGFRIVYALG